MSQPHQQAHFSFYTDEAVAGRQAERVANALERIQDATFQLSCQGLNLKTSPNELRRIAGAIECLQAELDFMADA